MSVKLIDLIQNKFGEFSKSTGQAYTDSRRCEREDKYE